MLVVIFSARLLHLGPPPPSFKVVGSLHTSFYNSSLLLLDVYTQNSVPWSAFQSIVLPKSCKQYCRILEDSVEAFSPLYQNKELISFETDFNRCSRRSGQHVKTLTLFKMLTVQQWMSKLEFFTTGEVKARQDFIPLLS